MAETYPFHSYIQSSLFTELIVYCKAIVFVTFPIPDPHDNINLCASTFMAASLVNNLFTREAVQ